MRTKSCTERLFSVISVLILTLLIVSISNAQITVTVSQFYSIFAPGQTQYYRHLDPSFNTVSIGKKGGPIIYDYSLVKLLPARSTNTYSISSIPILAARYPGTAVTFGNSRDSIEQNPVFLLSGDTVFATGEASLVPQYRFKHKRPYQPLRFPATYQSAYTYSGNIYDTTYNSTGGVVLVRTGPFNDSIVVDGYGTLKTPDRQLECLRLKLLHATTGEKEIMFLTREGVFCDISVLPGQPDTGFVQVSDVTVLMPAAFVGVIRETLTPSDFSLQQNFPNPFNPTTTIRFTLPQRSHVRLTVADLLGRDIATVVDGELEAGTHSSVFDGNQFSSGVYFYRLQSGSLVQTKKLVLIK
ncbi:MAG: T9SS type A sorting domain-containing protein [Bacteroidota bacterium]|jgi:hypothetical protein